MAIHRSSGYPGVRRTIYFVRRICPATPKAAVKMAIRTCEECQSIDPTRAHSTMSHPETACHLHTSPPNKIYRYEVRVKGGDAPITSSGPGRSHYQVGNSVWFKTAQNQCTSKFGNGRVTEMISPQSVLVDEVLCHVKDQRPQHSVTSLEEDSNATLSESEAESLLCDTEDIESDDSPKEGAMAEPPPVPLRRSTRRKQPPPDCHIFDHEIRGSIAREETYLLDQSA